MITLLRKRWFGPKLTCKEVDAFLAEYLEGTLDPKIQKGFKKHLHMCPNCPVFLEQYRQTVHLLKDQPTPKPPRELVDHTLAFLRKRLPR